MSKRLTAPIDDAPENAICSFMKCLTCPQTECGTGQEARAHGKKGYQACLKMLDEAEKDGTCEITYEDL